MDWNDPYLGPIIFLCLFVLSFAITALRATEMHGHFGWDRWCATQEPRYKPAGTWFHIFRVLGYGYYCIGWFLTFPIQLARYQRLADWEATQEDRDAQAYLDALPSAVVEHVKKEIAYDDYFNQLKAEIARSALKLAEHSFTKIALPERPSERLAFLREKFKTDDLVKLIGDIVVSAWMELLKTLPSYVEWPGTFETSLFSTFRDASPLNAFFHTFQRDDRLFWDIFIAYMQSWHAAEAAVKAKMYPKDSRQYYERIISPAIYFNPALITLPVIIPQHLRFEGMWVIAPPGRGKTTLLSQLLSFDLDEVKAGKASIILMDSKGDLIDHARRLERFAPGGDLEGKLVLIEPRPDLALNPLDLGTTATHRLALSEYILDGLMNMGTTEKQGSVFRRVLVALNTIPGATFETLIKFLHDWHPYEEYVKTLDPDDRDFFTAGAFDGKEYRGTRDELVWRIDGMMTKVPLVRSMLKSPTTRLDLGKEMDSGKVIIIDNSQATLADGTEFFSRFFVALILSAAQQRAGRKEEDKLPCYVYIDECDTAIRRDLKIAEIIQRCRSQKIGLVLAHQTLTQIDSAKVQAALSDCAIRMANSDDEASQLAPRLRTTPEVLRSLKKGKFALFMRTDPTAVSLVVDVDNNPISGWEKMTDSQFADIQRDMRERYCFTRQKGEPEPVQPEPDTGPASWG